MNQPKISDQAVREATGWDWSEWFALLDEEGAKGLDHKGITKVLREEGKLTKAWWTQMIAVEYARSRGLREVGETSDVGFEVGVRRTFETTPKRVWDILTRTAGANVWLGALKHPTWQKGETYETADGTTGEIRTVRPGQHIRLTWRPMGWENATTLQVSVLPVSRYATLAFHQENLPSSKERERMKKHWGKVLDALGELF